MASLQNPLDELIHSATSRGDEGIPGVAVVITRSTGEVYKGAGGLRDFTQPEKHFTPDTVVWIASMSKAITSVAALQCVERGLVGLDDDLSTLIPELRDLQKIDRSKPLDDGNYTLKPATKKVTLRHMLTHSNGLIYPGWYPHGEAYCEKNGIPPFRSATRDAFKFPSWHETGAEWHYGLGIDYAGLMIEKLSGQRLGEYITANIFKPLGMDSSSFTLTPELAARKATVYQRGSDGKVTAIPDPWPHTVQQDLGGGGLWSTATAYSKFLRMLLSKGQSPDGHSVLKYETLQMATKGHLEPAAKVSCNNAHKETSLSKWPGVKRDYGLIGMVFEEELATGRAIGSVQWDGAPSCHWSIDMTKDIGIVQVVQIMPFGDAEVQKLLRAVETATYDALAP